MQRCQFLESLPQPTVQQQKELIEIKQILVKLLQDDIKCEQQKGAELDRDLEELHNKLDM